MSKRRPPVYLLLGPEIGRKADFISSVRETLQKNLGENPEEHHIYPFKSNMQEVISLLQNTSLFTTHKIVIVSDAHDIKSKGDANLLVSYCKQPADDATLILASPKFSIDRRIEAAVPKEHKKIFWELFERDKHAWLHNFFRKADLVLTQEASEMILELVENDTQAMRRECERLSLYLDKGTVVDEDTVETYIYHSKAENVFSLFEKLAQNDFVGALEIYESIRLAGESDAVQLLGGLLWQLRRLMAFQRLVRRQYSPTDAGKKLAIRGKKNQKTYTTGCGNYTLQNLEQIIVLANQYEAYLRSVRKEVQELMMQLFLFHCIVKKGASDIRLTNN